ncbi:MAG: hypothetical protein M3R47_18340 [Chloroflexota bacterium]|nr:hypothetical protein [Chloroflexota bacterium]
MESDSLLSKFVGANSYTPKTHGSRRLVVMEMPQIEDKQGNVTLSTAKGLREGKHAAHGGRIIVRSQAHHGTNLVIHLLLARKCLIRIANYALSL